MGLSSPPPPYSAVGAGGGRTSGALQPGAQKGWARLKARGFPRRVQLPLWWRRRFVVLAGRRLLLFAEPPPSGALANASSYIHASGNYGGLRIKVIELDDLEWLLPETWFSRTQWVWRAAIPQGPRPAKRAAAFGPHALLGVAPDASAEEAQRACSTLTLSLTHTLTPTLTPTGALTPPPPHSHSQP